MEALERGVLAGSRSLTLIGVGNSLLRWRAFLAPRRRVGWSKHAVRHPAWSRTCVHPSCWCSALSRHAKDGGPRSGIVIRWSSGVSSYSLHDPGHRRYKRLGSLYVRTAGSTAVCGTEQEGTRNPGGHSMAKTRPRKRYTEDQRATILSVAQREGLTATEVKKRFGVTPVTYYSWRKKTGVAGRRGQAIRVAGGNAALSSQVRTEVRSRVRQILPAIVRGEVSSYLNTLFPSGRGRRRARV